MHKTIQYLGVRMMYFDLRNALLRMLWVVIYVVAGLSLVFLASLVWHYGEFCLRGWF